MLYEIALVIPANTAETAKTETKIKVWGGVLHSVHIHIPNGCAGLAHAQLVQGGHQFAPSTEKQSFYGDGTDIKYPEHLELKPGWNTITLRGWNTDTAFEHTITAWIGVLPEEYVSPQAIFIGIRDALRVLLSRIGIAV